MDRRRFLGTLLGAGAAVALPSEVWPFRKIFLPPVWKRWVGIDMGYHEPFTWVLHPDQLAAIQALELETFAREIPDLLHNEATFWNLLKRRDDPSKIISMRRVLGPSVIYEPALGTPADRAAAEAANQVLRATDVRKLLKF